MGIEDARGGSVIADGVSVASDADASLLVHINSETAYAPASVPNPPPSACCDIMLQCACLKEAKYISYLNVPTSDASHISVGEDIDLYRNAVVQHVGYNLETMESTQTIWYKNGREVTKAVKLDHGNNKASGMEVLNWELIQ